MGMWDEYCTVCGGPPYVFFDEEHAQDGEPLTTPLPNPEDYTWLESFLGISNKEEVIPLGSYGGYANFDTIPDTSPYNDFSIGCRNDDDDEKTAQGYACHVACSNLLQQELNYTLKYADVRPLLANNEFYFNKFHWSDYGGLAEYQDQGLWEVQLVEDGKLWMIEDPSQNAKNKERILELWRPLVESGFQRPEESRAGEDGSRAPDIAGNEPTDESRARRHEDRWV